MLTKWLDEAKTLGLSAGELYINALGEFGGVATPLPSEPSPYNLFAWMKSNFTRLSGFVRGAIDFGALSLATNLSKTLIKSGCNHVDDLRERKEFECLVELGEPTRGLNKMMRNFMRSFWLKFDRASARSLVKARRAVVR